MTILGTREQNTTRFGDNTYYEWRGFRLRRRNTQFYLSNVPEGFSVSVTPLGAWKTQIPTRASSVKVVPDPDS